MDTRYRICKNGYGEFKVQIWHSTYHDNETGLWENYRELVFYPFLYKPFKKIIYFKSKEEAENKIAQLKEEERLSKWECQGEY